MTTDGDFLRKVACRISTSPRDEAFVSGLLANPRDTELRDGYFDWLRQQGDPRGEYLDLLHVVNHVGLAVGAREYERIRLRKDELRATIDPVWLGILLGEPVPAVVRRIEDDCFWVDLGGGLEGQVHITDLSW